MERFLQKEHALLNYTSRRSLGSQKLIRNSSEVDFNDVFGGPPRRSSMQDWRDRADSSSSRGEEDVASSSDVWSGLGQKPVFGGENMNRRKYPSDEFYEDIFRGDESFSSTPQKPGRDYFPSTPASRVQSPVRPMQRHSDPFGSSSLPPVLSLPMKIAKDIESPTFSAPCHSPLKNSESSPNGLGFPSSPNVLLSRISTQVMQGQGELRNDPRSFNRQSSLSKEFFPESDGSSLVTKSNKQDIEDHSKRNSSTEVIDSTCQFHFSIYKWARTGIPVVMPLRDANLSGLKGRARPEKRSNKFYEPVFEGGEIPSLGDNMLPIHKPFQHDSENQNDSSVLNTKKDRVETQDVEEVICAKPESKPLVAIENVFEEVPGDLPSQTVGKESKRDCSASGAAAKKGLSEDTEKKMPTSKQREQESEPIPLYWLLKDDTCRQGNKGIEQARGKEGKEKRTPVPKKKGNKSEPPPLYCLLNDDSDRQGHDKIVEQARGKEEKVRSLNIFAEEVAKGKKGKKQTGKGNNLNYSEVTNSRLQDSPVNAEEKLISNKVKGKVKDFVKIFNREPSSERITTDEVPDRVPAVNDSSISTAEDQANVHEVEADGKGKVTSMKKRTSYSISSVDKTSKQSVNPHLGVNTAACQTYDMYSERVNGPASYSEKIPESAGVPVGNVDESHCPLLDCMVKELSQNPNEQAKTGQLTEDLQVWDAKIRKWSNGKEGNIRSLLSTLQYVLWPESGWKPVPLVDIIEGNPVKRAYQKALLCLHPDKLQQKGAATHQKYIAEKVFDILQEAWIQFNSLDSI